MIYNTNELAIALVNSVSIDIDCIIHTTKAGVRIKLGIFLELLMNKPTYSEVASELGVSTAVVQNIVTRCINPIWRSLPHGKGARSFIREVLFHTLKVKRCGRCYQYKDLEDYHNVLSAIDGKEYKCKDCVSSENITFAQQRLEVVISLGGRCIDCGTNDLEVLEFDHRNPINKVLNVSETRSIGTLKHEVEKCDLVCANCHRKRTAKTQNWSKSRILSDAA